MRLELAAKKAKVPFAGHDDEDLKSRRDVGYELEHKKNAPEWLGAGLKNDVPTNPATAIRALRACARPSRSCAGA